MIDTGKKIYLPYEMVCYVTTIDRYENHAQYLSHVSAQSTESALFAMAAKDMAHACGMEHFLRKDFSPRFFLATDFNSGDFVPCAVFKQENNGSTFIVSTAGCLNGGLADSVFYAIQADKTYEQTNYFGFGHFQEYKILKDTE